MTYCRVCKASMLKPVLDLGMHPLANDFQIDSERARSCVKYCLDVGFCGNCTTLQLIHTVDPALMFSEYAYFSSAIPGVVRHAQLLAEVVRSRTGLSANNKILEIASNDGYLLKQYRRMGHQVVGVDPARNVALKANDDGIFTICDYFSPEVAERFSHPFDVVHASNVLAHVSDPNLVLGGIKSVLAPHGTLVVETPHVVPMLDNCEFDTIYHEHIFYYSLHSLLGMFRNHALQIVDAETLAYHGGSIRLWVKHAGDKQAISPRVSELIAMESAWGVETFSRYELFSESVSKLKATLLATLEIEAGKNRRMAAYGAAAKGSTLLNTFGIESDLIEFVVDDSPHKQHLFMPGNGIPIFSREALISNKIDLALVLAWNFIDDIVDANREWLSTGGKFIVPIPKPRIVGGQS